MRKFQVVCALVAVAMGGIIMSCSKNSNPAAPGRLRVREMLFFLRALRKALILWGYYTFKLTTPLTGD